MMLFVLEWDASLAQLWWPLQFFWMIYERQVRGSITSCVSRLCQRQSDSQSVALSWCSLFVSGYFSSREDVIFVPLSTIKTSLNALLKTSHRYGCILIEKAFGALIGWWKTCKTVFSSPPCPIGADADRWAYVANDGFMRRVCVCAADRQLTLTSLYRQWRRVMNAQSGSFSLSICSLQQPFNMYIHVHDLRHKQPTAIHLASFKCVISFMNVCDFLSGIHW